MPPPGPKLIHSQYCLDMIRVGDALLAVMGAARINYETWGNVDPALHTHIVPRYLSEPEEKRVLQVCRAYDPKLSRSFDAVKDKKFIEQVRDFLRKFSDGH